MLGKDKFSPDEKALKTMSTHALIILKEKGLQMEAEIAKKNDELLQLTVEGFSNDGLTKVIMDGNYSAIEISIDPDFSDWGTDQLKSCSNIIEAIDDAKYKVDLIKETKISTIQYKYTREFIESGLSLKREALNRGKRRRTAFQTRVQSN